MALHPHIPGGCPLLNTAIEVDDTDEAFRKLAQSSVKEVISMIEEILEEGKSAGFFSSAVEAKKEAQYLFASIEGAIMLSRVTKDTKSFIEIFDKAVTYFEDNIVITSP